MESINEFGFYMSFSSIVDTIVFRLRTAASFACTFLSVALFLIGSLTPSKVLPLLDITEHKAVDCLVLPR